MHVRDVPTRVIARIAKLLRLARHPGTGQEEAANAEAQAERLMDKWNIEVDPGLEADDQVTEISFTVRPNCVPWRHTLAGAVGLLYDVTVDLTRDHTENPKYWLRCSGSAESLLRFRLHFRFLETEIERLVWKAMPRSSRHVLALGAARYVLHLIQEELGSPAPAAEPEGELDPMDLGFDPWEEEEEAEPAAALPGETAEPVTALSRMPRRRVQPPVGAPESATPPPSTHVLEVDLPERQQNAGVALAAHSRTIRKYAARPHPALELPVEAIALGSRRAKTALRDANIRYVGELVFFRRDQLLAVRGIGPVTIAMMETDLSIEGLHLRPEDPFEDS